MTEVTYLGVRPRDAGRAPADAAARRGHDRPGRLGARLPRRSRSSRAYCAAKHAIHGFTESLRAELLHDGSRVRVTHGPPAGDQHAAVRLGPQPPAAPAPARAADLPAGGRRRGDRLGRGAPPARARRGLADRRLRSSADKRRPGARRPLPRPDRVRRPADRRAARIPPGRTTCSSRFAACTGPMDGSTSGRSPRAGISGGPRTSDRWARWRSARRSAASRPSCWDGASAFGRALARRARPARPRRRRGRRPWPAGRPGSSSCRRGQETQRRDPAQVAGGPDRQGVEGSVDHRRAGRREPPPEQPVHRPGHRAEREVGGPAQLALLFRTDLVARAGPMGGLARDHVRRELAHEARLTTGDHQGAHRRGRHGPGDGADHRGAQVVGELGGRVVLGPQHRAATVPGRSGGPPVAAIRSVAEGLEMTGHPSLSRCRRDGPSPVGRPRPGTIDVP